MAVVLKPILIRVTTPVPVKKEHLRISLRHWSQRWWSALEVYVRCMRKTTIQFPNRAEYCVAKFLPCLDSRRRSRLQDPDEYSLRTHDAQFSNKSTRAWAKT